MRKSRAQTSTLRASTQEEKLAFQFHVLDFSEALEKFQMELIELSKDNIVKS